MTCCLRGIGHQETRLLDTLVNDRRLNGMTSAGPSLPSPLAQHTTFFHKKHSSHEADIETSSRPHGSAPSASSPAEAMQFEACMGRASAQRYTPGKVSLVAKKRYIRPRSPIRKSVVPEPARRRDSVSAVGLRGVRMFLGAPREPACSLTLCATVCCQLHRRKLRVAMSLTHTGRSIRSDVALHSKCGCSTIVRRRAVREATEGKTRVGGARPCTHRNNRGG